MSGRLVAWTFAGLIAVAIVPKCSAAAEGSPIDTAAGDALPKRGALIEVPLPLDESQARQIRSAIAAFAASAKDSDERPVLVLQLGSAAPAAAGAGTSFEDALSIARLLNSPDMARIATVAYLAQPIEGHAVLVALACEQWIAGPEGGLNSVSRIEGELDPTVKLVYDSIARRRGTLPAAAVESLFAGHGGLIRLEMADGGQQFATDAGLEEARRLGQVIREDRLVPPGQPVQLDADQLRKLRWTTHTAADGQPLLDALRLADWEPIQAAAEMQLRGGTILIAQPLTPRLANRLRRSIADAVEGGTNQLLIHIDATEADLDASLGLAEYLSNLDRARVRVDCLVTQPIAPAAAAVAVAGQTLWMGSAGQLRKADVPSDGSLTNRQSQQLTELVERRQRSPAVLRSLLGDPEPVYRWTNRRTGRIAIASELERVQQRDLDSWERGQQVVIEDGLSADQAIELGIADGRAGTMEQLAVAAGLPTVPAPVRDRWLVSELENLAGQTWLMRILLFVGFFALSVELGSPGLGVPGFVSMVCLLFYFWAQFLNGTAEWLEVLLFLGGVACLAVELLLLPGFGIFGLGGVLMIIASLILASQTFVLPHDSRELAAVSGNLVGVFIACGGVVAGLVTLRYFAHQIPLLRELVLPQPSDDVLAERDLREAMVAWEYLQGQTGKAISVLRPAGKARFGDATVAVVAQGEFIDAGESVRVVDVQGNRVTVERLPG